MNRIAIQTSLPGPKSRAILNRLKEKNGAFNIDHAYVHSGEGKGSHFADVDGNVFLDFAGQIASNPLGYNNAAMLKVLQKHSNFTPIKYGGQDFTVPQHLHLLEELLKIVPKPMDAAFLINSGAEANENAIKIACHRNPAAKIGISFYNGWHGRTTGALSLTNSRSVQVKHYLRIPVRHISFTDNAAQEIEELILREYAPDEIGFVAVENVQGEGGYYPATKTMMQGIRKTTKKYGIPLICDEVQSGMGRTGKWWAYQHYDIVPDIQTCAKALQVAATVSKKSMFPTEGGAISSTWGGGHVLDMAMGAAIIREIKKKKLMKNATRMGNEIHERLKEIHTQYETIHHPRGLGLMQAFDLSDTKTRNQVRDKCFQNGLIVLGCGWSGIRMSPSLNITKEEVNEGMNIIEDVVKTIKKN
ncbi:MAG: aspartate aminotransferase family protein [Candidatus Diapherotrites archaeon]|uniref:Aspartate aminotransferase family protein n=1 Tax=Candidatus Iainarchaeum sp. TaxID=3101447 RepID=A0A8T4CBP7_9ARCH|nr:aspartate aminotransferase family protein [Candidatus Diapherotrites archaeon]